MIATKNTYEKVRMVVTQNSTLMTDEISLHTRLDSLNIDSLEFLELILQVQEVCHVTIPDEVIAKLATVADICAAVENSKSEVA